MFSVVAYYESQDGGGALHNVAAVQDQHITVSGDDVRVPDGMPNIIGQTILSAATTLTSARLNSPSLRRICYLDIEPLLNAVVFGSPPEAIMHPYNPIPLDVDEGLRCEINSDNDGAAVEYGLVWLSDGPQNAVTGNIYTISATTSITLAAGMWVNGNLTFSQTLPSGEYEIVGMRARGTNLVAARLVFVDEAAHRPGVCAINAAADLEVNFFRYGRIGSFGRFKHTSPPTVDALGVTDSSQSYLFDIVKVS